MTPMQPGNLQAVTGWKPETTIEEGVQRFVAWYREHYGTD
jgi:UDP-glucuronate 4-epimerase